MRHIDAIHEVESILNSDDYYTVGQFENTMENHGWVLIDTDARDMAQRYRKNGYETIILLGFEYAYKCMVLAPVMHSLYTFAR